MSKTTFKSFDDDAWRAWLGLAGAGVAAVTLGRKIIKGEQTTLKDWIGGVVGVLAIWGALGA